jgi:hypothetical protein
MEMRPSGPAPQARMCRDEAPGLTSPWEEKPIGLASLESIVRSCAS